MSTLTDRGKGRHKSQKIASAKRQLLTVEEEDVLVQWCILRGQTGEPWTSSDLRNEAEKILGKAVGSRWHLKFEKRHPEIFASKLDPKRAKQFNETIINEDFFAPSKALSSVAHVPDTFPDDAPSSDPMRPSDIDVDYVFGDNKTGSSDSDSDSQNSTIRVVSESEDDLDLDGLESENNDGQDADGLEMDVDRLDDDICQAEVSKPKPVFSGLLASTANIENDMTRSSTAGLDLFSVAPPPIVSLEEDKLLSADERLQEIQHLRQQLTHAYQCLGHAVAQLSASNAHCTTIRQELDHAQQQLEHATKQKERGSTKIQGTFFTSRSYRAEFDREDAERREREHLAGEKNKQKEAEKAETARRILSDSRDRIFVGNLTSYKKDDLQALALALQLSDDGTKDDLKMRISEKFENDSNLKQNPRFNGLFNKSRRRASGPDDANDPVIDKATQSCIVQLQALGPVQVHPAV